MQLDIRVLDGGHLVWLLDDSSSSIRMDGIKSVLEGQGVRKFSFCIGTATMSAWRNQKLGGWSSASFCPMYNLYQCRVCSSNTSADQWLFPL